VTIRFIFAFVRNVALARRRI